MISVTLILLIVLFILFPVMSTPILLLMMIINKKHAKKYLFLFVLGISIIILRYVPYVRDDGAYHYHAAYIFSSYNNIYTFITELYKGYIYGLKYDYQNYPIYGIILYIFSKTYMYSLISFVVCFATYYFYLYIVVDIYQKNKINVLFFVSSFMALLLLNNYRFTTSGMRYCLCVSMIVFLFYIESQQVMKKNKMLIFYIIPCLIHPAAWIYVIFKILYFIFNKISFIKSIIVIIIPSILIIGIPLIANMINNSYLDMIVNKILVYQSNESYNEAFNSTLVSRIYIGFLSSFLFAVLCFYILYFKHYHLKRYSNFITITYYMCMLNIGMIFYQNIIDRNTFILLPMIVISLLFIVIETQNILFRKNYDKFFTIIIGYNLGLIVLGFLYNRNFPFHLLDYSIVEILTTNVIQFFDKLPVYY